MPAAEDPSDDFEMLRQQHERFLEELVPNDDAEEDGGEQQIYGKEAAVTTGPFGPTKASSRKTQTFSFNDMSSSSPSVSMSGISSSWTESSSCSAETPAILTGGGGLNPEKKSSKPMMNLGIKPQFNLDSASKLLASFRHMLPHLPCLVLPEDVDVRSLARGAPFVLLAILAVTSCSSSLQGHSLYDEEFRKVLGLKFVAGGERSLELLQGILIYCAW
jgi:hypothetical protein